MEAHLPSSPLDDDDKLPNLAKLLEGSPTPSEIANEMERVLDADHEDALTEAIEEMRAAGKLPPPRSKPTE
jgi:hypothetical protein